VVANSKDMPTHETSTGSPVRPPRKKPDLAPSSVVSHSPPLPGGAQHRLYSSDSKLRTKNSGVPLRLPPPPQRTPATAPSHGDKPALPRRPTTDYGTTPTIPIAALTDPNFSAVLFPSPPALRRNQSQELSFKKTPPPRPPRRNMSITS